MNNDFTCPFCNHTFPLISDTYRCYESSFARSDSSLYPQKPTNMLFVKFYSNGSFTAAYSNKKGRRIHAAPFSFSFIRSAPNS